MPETFEWVVETTPSLASAACVDGLHVQELPLLSLEQRLRAAEPAQRDEHAAGDAKNHARLRQRLADGATVMYVLEDGDGPIASGAHEPVDGVTVFLSAAGEDVARLYERLGFERVGQAGLAEPRRGPALAGRPERSNGTRLGVLGASNPI